MFDIIALGMSYALSEALSETCDGSIGPILVLYQHVVACLLHTIFACKSVTLFNTLRQRQNGCHFAGDIFKFMFLYENFRISKKISVKFVPKGPINNNPALV